MAKFNERLKEARLRKNISQREFSEDIGVIPGAVALWETGDRRPGMDQLQAISDYFNLSVDYLIGREDVSYRYLDTDQISLIESYNNADETTREMVRRLLAYSDQLKK